MVQNSCLEWQLTREIEHLDRYFKLKIKYSENKETETNKERDWAFKNCDSFGAFSIVAEDLTTSSETILFEAVKSAEDYLALFALADSWKFDDSHFECKGLSGGVIPVDAYCVAYMYTGPTQWIWELSLEVDNVELDKGNYLYICSHTFQKVKIKARNLETQAEFTVDEAIRVASSINYGSSCKLIDSAPPPSSGTGNGSSPSTTHPVELSYNQGDTTTNLNCQIVSRLNKGSVIEYVSDQRYVRLLELSSCSPHKDLVNGLTCSYSKNCASRSQSCTYRPNPNGVLQSRDVNITKCQLIADYLPLSDDL